MSIVPGAASRPERSRAAAFAAAMILSISAVFATAGAPTPAGAATNPTSFIFHGGGWGHGVGMSQYGARGMATNGSTATQILTHYYTGAAVSSVSESTGHRVIVAPPAPKFTFTAGTSMVVAGNGGTVLGTAGAGAVVTVTRVGEGMLIAGAVSGLAGTLTISFTGPVRISPPNHAYRYGSLTVVPDGTANLATRVVGISMTQLLYGLGEMPSLWPTEALKSQAIAARTFAQKRRAANGDLRAWMDISYVGYDKETGGYFDRWKAAVDGTVGKVVTYSGALIDALFSASSGGYTENSEYVFVSALPYLRAVADPGDLVTGNPFATWTKTYTAAEIGSWFGVGTATAVQITGNVGVSGRTNRATIHIVGTTATKDVSSSTFRNTVAAKDPSRALISPKFTIEPYPAPTATPRTPVLPVGVITVAKADGHVITIAGTVYDPDGAPTMRVVSTMGTTTAVRTVKSSGGKWSVSWTGAAGTRKICVSALDVPSGTAVSLGCKSVTVK